MKTETVKKSVRWSIILFYVLLFSSSVLAITYYTDQMNFQPGEARNHTQYITYTGDNLTVVVPAQFTIISNSSGSTISGNNITWGSGVSRDVDYTIESPDNCTENTFFDSQIYRNDVLNASFRYVCIPDSKIVDYKLEYGHGDANYLSEDYISNESVTLFNLIRVFNIGHYLDPDENPVNAKINCTFENLPVRTFGRVDLNHHDDVINGVFTWSSIQSGYWFRIGVVSQDLSGKVLGDYYNVSCNDLTYNFTNHQVKASYTNKTIQVRNTAPFTISVTEFSDRLRYVINHTELYSLEDVDFRWSVAGTHKSESYRKVLPDDSLQFDVYLSGNDSVDLEINYVPSWYANSRNPMVYTQTRNQGYNISSAAAAISGVDGSLIRSINNTVSLIRNSQTANFRIEMSDFDELNSNNLYRARLLVFDYEGKPQNADSLPNITLYDPVRSVIANTTMSLDETGVYTYTNNITNGNTTGVWETIVSAVIDGTTVKPNDYWELEGSPAEVKINSITDNVITTIIADATITNEGQSGQEYQYEYCIVAEQANQCGGDDDLGYASAAKFISPGDSFNTALTLNGITQTGPLYFKLVVYFGTEKSGASLLFTAVAASPAPAAPGAGGGGGGGGGAAAPRVITPEEIPEEVIEVIEREGTLDLTGYPIAITVFKPDLMRKTFQISNVGEGDLTNVRMRIEGLPSGSYEIVKDYYSSVPPSEKRPFSIDFSNDYFDIGTYDLKLIVSSDQGTKEIDGVLIVREEITEKPTIQEPGPGSYPPYLWYLLIPMILFIMIFIIIIHCKAHLFKKRPTDSRKKSQRPSTKKDYWEEIEEKVKNIK